MQDDRANEAGRIGLDLGNTSKETLELFVEEAADPSIFKEILESNKSRPDVIRLLYEHGNTPDDVRSEAAEALKLPVLSSTQVAEVKKKSHAVRPPEPEEARMNRLTKKVGSLSVSEKIKLALKGGGEARGILIRDSNKLVVLSVLDNPKITESEIEAVARNRSVMEDALRVITKNREWMKNYSVQLALTNNPKTPVPITIKLVPYLKKKDIQMLEKNKNVPEAVRATARKFAKASKG